MFAGSARHGRPLSLIVFDIDEFKGYNDAFGHVAGDEALKQIGALVASLVRDGDVPARDGGEKFALLLPETDGLAAIGRRRAVSSRHREIPLGASPHHGQLRRLDLFLGDFGREPFDRRGRYGLISFEVERGGSSHALLQDLMNAAA